jgi:hypothetical protein
MCWLMRTCGRTMCWIRWVVLMLCITSCIVSCIISMYDMSGLAHAFVKRSRCWIRWVLYDATCGAGICCCVVAQGSAEMLNWWQHVVGGSGLSWGRLLVGQAVLTSLNWHTRVAGVVQLGFAAHALFVACLLSFHTYRRFLCGCPCLPSLRWVMCDVRHVTPGV